MSYIIDWSKIKKGYRGFEALAVCYVQKNYDALFKQSKSTRDGNKDATLEKDDYTIVLGYQSPATKKIEWWMEAKYSKTSKYLTRYRLDATLVSAILKGNVRRIIFVTNISINSRSINDIRQAIISVSTCQEVDFCTKDTLEYWLYQNPDILKEYFPKYNNESIELKNLMLVEPAKFYAVEKSRIVFKESLNVLELGESYDTEFVIYSKRYQTLSIKAAAHLKGITKIKPHQIELHPGLNYPNFSFMLETSYGFRHKKAREEHIILPSPAFLLGSLDIPSKNHVTINEHLLQHYIVPSQVKLLNDIKKFFHSHSSEDKLQLLYICGQSGVGKSYVLDLYLKSKANTNQIVFTCDMTGRYEQDVKSLLRCINFIYFPYLPDDNINRDYLDKISVENYIPPYYYKLVSYAENEDALGQLICKYISENICLFPSKFSVNTRMIIFDNFHKANELIINAIYKIVLELFLIKAPYKFILLGQQIRHTSAYNVLSENMLIQELKLTISIEDCIALVPNLPIKDLIVNLSGSKLLFSNMIELILFIKFIKDSGRNVSDFETLGILYHLFFRENMLNTYIKRIFNDALINDPAAASLCNQVYWSSVGISCTNSQEEHKLLCNHIIKLDAKAQKLIPYHDIYAKYYRKNYSCNKISDISFVQLLETPLLSERESAINNLHAAYKEKNYIQVYYTLESIFISDLSEIYRNLLGDITYYTLFYEFAHSCAFCSIDYSGRKLFQRIYNETENLFNPTKEIYCITNACLWELTNSTYEALAYDEALILCKSLINHTKKLIKRKIITGSLEDSVRYHNANVIICMIKSERQEKDNFSFYANSAELMLKYNKIDRYWSFRVRYSLTLLHQNHIKAVEILSECCNYYDEQGKSTEKYFLWSHFYYSYAKMIMDDDYSEEENAFSILEVINQLFFNDYRKMILGIITYLYYRKEIEKADILLLKDCYVMREKRPRFKGFWHLANALRSVLTQNISRALFELQSAYDIFEHLPSYGNMILHNIELLQAGYWDAEDGIKYYLGGDVHPNTYYIDIRCCW